MRAARSAVVASILVLSVVAAQPARTAPAAATGYQQFLSAASPLEIVAARKADKIAWVAFEEGQRNAYSAAAPAFTPVRLTSFLKDDGVDLSAPRISDDG
jgi:hypothetical protein